MKMNTPSPLVPQGSLPDKGRSHFRITVLATVAVHVVLLCVLLIAGCNKKDTTDQAANPDNTGGLPVPQSTEPPPWPTPPPPPPVTPTQDNAGLIPPPFVPPNPVLPPPVAFTPEPVAAVATGTEHTIVKGEFLSTIAKKYGIGWKAIEAANPGINPTRLKVGDKIKIPAPKSGAAPSAAVHTDTAVAVDGSSVKTYKIKSGDNLMKIAKAHGVSVKAIRVANGLKTDQIKVGQSLKIPVKAPVPLAAPDTIITPAPAVPTNLSVPPPGVLPPGNP